MIRHSGTLAILVAAAILHSTPAVAQGQATSPPPRSRSVADVIANEKQPGEVTVAGRASVSSGKLQATVFDIAIQDSSGGIRVFSRSKAASVHEGDSVIATGRVKRYRGDLELAATSVRVVPGSRRTIAPRDIPIDASLIGRYRGQLVRVHGRVVGSGHSEGGQWMRLHGTHNTPNDSLTVWVPANHGATIDLLRAQVNDSVEATGIVTAYQDNLDDRVVWQLIPRDGADIHISDSPGRISAAVLWATLVIAILLGCAIAIGRYTARRQLAALRETEDRYRQLLELSPDAVIVHADGRIRFANPSAAELLGVTSEQDLVGRELVDFIAPDSRAVLDTALPSRDDRTGKAAPRVRARLLSAGGVVSEVELTMSACVYHDQAAVVMLARDISAQLRYERDLHALALVDELTGLQNRRGFNLFAEQELARARRHDRTPVVVFADLDGLKQINDAYGHAAGDAALRLTARALKSILRETDIVARWSGDEFVALMGEGGDSAASSIGERLDAALASLAPPDQPYTVTASVGTTPLDLALPLRDAMERADAELYAQKKRGRRSDRPTPTHISIVTE